MKRENIGIATINLYNWRVFLGNSVPPPPTTIYEWKQWINTFDPFHHLVDNNKSTNHSESNSPSIEVIPLRGNW